MKAPIKFDDLRFLVELGTFLDSCIVIDGNEHLFSIKGNTTPLFWSDASKALVLLVGYKLPRPTMLKEDDAHPLEKVFERWTRGREATKTRTIKIERPAGGWVIVGPAKTIGYRSDKFHARGIAVDYEHKFGRSIVAYKLGEKKSILVWAGGNLRITQNGIEG